MTMIDIGTIHPRNRQRVLDALSDLARMQTREGNLAELRGHRLEPWQRDGRYTAVTWCELCGLALILDSQPQSEDPPVEGSASVLACSGERGQAPTWAIQVPKRRAVVA